METIVSVGVNAVIFPFTVLSAFQDAITNQIIQWTRQVISVPSNIGIEVTDFAIHFAIWFCSLHQDSRPKSLTYAYDGHKMLFGFSCRSIFETAMLVLQRDLKSGKPLRVLTTPVHHKSLVQIMERLIDTDSIEVLTLDKRNRNIVVDKATEEAVKNCDVIVVTHMFGRNFDLRELIALKTKYNKILIVDSVLGGARTSTCAETGIDLDIYSTGQDKRPIAIGGGYCIPRNRAFDSLEAEILAYPVVSRMDRLYKIANTFLLRQIYNNKTWLFILVTVAPLLGLKVTSVVSNVRQQNPGFDHDGYLRCPSVSMCRSIQRELSRVQSMEDRYIHSWHLYLNNLPSPVLKSYYPHYDRDEDVIIPYNQLLLPPGHEQQFLEFCDDNKICAATNQNYKCMTGAASVYHRFVNQVVNMVRVVEVADDEIPFLTEALARYMTEDHVTVPTTTTATITL